jgi:GNAT superfamily N-acetyltransferase
MLTFCLARAPDADFGAIASLINDAFRTHEIFGGRDRTSPESVADEAGATGEFVLGYEDGELLACMMIRPAADLIAEWGGNSFIPDLPNAVYLGLAAVRPERMRSGIGRQLFDETERIIAERGFEHAVFGTLREFGLVPFFEGRGYTIVAQDDFEAGHWGMATSHRFYQMAKRLNTR